MATTKKALAISAEIAAELRLRIPALALVESTDTDLSPVIAIGNDTPGAANAVIKVVAQNWPLAKDILGLDSTIFTPHTIQVVLEKNFAGTTDNVADNLTMAQLLPVLGTVILRGCRVEVYQSDAGDSPDLNDITSAKLAATFDGNLVNGMISGQ